jgi:hypothetical protein
MREGSSVVAQAVAERKCGAWEVGGKAGFRRVKGVGNGVSGGVNEDGNGDGKGGGDGGFKKMREVGCGGGNDEGREQGWRKGAHRGYGGGSGPARGRCRLQRTPHLLVPLVRARRRAVARGGRHLERRRGDLRALRAPDPHLLQRSGAKHATHACMECAIGVTGKACTSWPLACTSCKVGRRARNTRKAQGVASR